MHSYTPNKKAHKSWNFLWNQDLLSLSNSRRTMDQRQTTGNKSLLSISYIGFKLEFHSALRLWQGFFQSILGDWVNFSLKVGVNTHPKTSTKILIRILIRLQDQAAATSVIHFCRSWAVFSHPYPSSREVERAVLIHTYSDLRETGCFSTGWFPCWFLLSDAIGDLVRVVWVDGHDTPAFNPQLSHHSLISRPSWLRGAWPLMLTMMAFHRNLRAELAHNADEARSNWCICNFGSHFKGRYIGCVKCIGWYGDGCMRILLMEQP